MAPAHVGPRVFIALGSNLGDRAAHLAYARRALKASSCTVVQESSVVETPPWGVADQPAFLNQVVEARTDLAPEELLRLLLQIETKRGRQRNPNARWGPRTLDLDLLAYGNVVATTPKLLLPHPQLAARSFVLEPWAEIAPKYCPPGYDVSIETLWKRLKARNSPR